MPRLKIDGQPIRSVEVSVYLGDQFNSAGTNKHLVDDRTKKGQACIISAMSMCSENTMGVYSIETMLLLYNSLFLPVVLYNSQSWSNLTKKDINTLKVVQLKFLKRMFYAPSSTSNCITYLETGAIPIDYEIHIRQLNFLHHVVNLEESDPVRKVYNEQLKFADEPNWGNEVKKLRSKYELTPTDSDLQTVTKDWWKTQVKKAVKQHVLDILNEDVSKQKNGALLGRYEQIGPQPYLHSLQPRKARKLFHIRAGILDVRAVRKYWYSDDSCRLCHKNQESVDHIVNHCELIPRDGMILDITTNKLEEMEAIADRCIQFELHVKELELTGDK